MLRVLNPCVEGFSPSFLQCRMDSSYMDLAVLLIKNISNIPAERNLNINLKGN